MQFFYETENPGFNNSTSQIRNYKACLHILANLLCYEINKGTQVLRYGMKTMIQMDWQHTKSYLIIALHMMHTSYYPTIVHVSH